MLLTTSQTCGCGRTFEVPGELSRTTVMCPACTRLLFVPDKALAATKPLSSNPFDAVYRPDGLFVLDWTVGDVYLDVYEVRALLGEGGMGKVYRVYHRLWDLEIAVKCPSPKILAYHGGIEYFERECNTWVNLGLHPHLATCYYVRRVSGAPRIFTEYVDSGDLLNWINDGRLYAGSDEDALSRIVCIALQCAWALDYAHDQEIIHRDVKPSNILLTRDGVAKVTDFGLAKSLRSSAREVRAVPSSHSGMTPAYCSPEQFHGEALSPASDMWSWAVTVLQMFTRRITWSNGPDARSAIAQKDLLLTGDGVAPAMPESVWELLNHTLQQRPDDRPSSWSEIAEWLARVHEKALGRPVPCPEPAQAIPRAENLNNRAVSLEDLGEAAHAESKWSEALRIAPNHPESAFNFALQQWRSARITDEDALQSVRSLGASTPDLVEMLAEIHLERGDCGSALALLESEGSTSPLAGVAKNCFDSSRRIRYRLPVHADAINGIRASRVENLLITLSSDNAIRIAYLDSGREIRTLAGHTSSIEQFRIDDDVQVIVSGARDRTIRLWDVGTGECVFTCRADWDQIHAVAFGDESASILVAADENRIYRLDKSTGQVMGVCQGPNGYVILIALSADGRRAISVQDTGVLHVWDTGSGRVERSLHLPSSEITCVSFDHSGEWVAAGTADGRIICWNHHGGEPPVELAGHRGVVHSAVFTRDLTHLVSAGDDGTCRLWEIESRRCLTTLSEGGAAIYAVAASEDGAVAVTGDKSGVVAVWELNAGVVYRAAPFRLSRGTSAEAGVVQEESFRLAMNRASSLLAAGDDVAAMDALISLRNECDGGSRKDALVLWTRLYRVCAKNRFRGPWRMTTFRCNGGPVRSVAWNEDNTALYSVDQAGFLKCWDLAADSLRYEVQAHMGPALDVACGGATSQVVTGGQDRVVQSWDGETGRALLTMEGHAAPVTSVQVSPCGNFAISSGWDLRLWNLNLGSLLDALENSRINVSIVRWNADGQSFLTAGGESLQQRHARTLENIGEFAFRPHMVEAIEVTADSRYAIVGCNRLAAQGSAVHVLELKSGRRVQVTESDSSRIRSVKATGDGRFWASLYESGRTEVHAMETGECCGEFQASHAHAITAALARDGSMMAVGCADGAIEVWGLDWELTCERPNDWETRVQPYIACGLRSIDHGMRADASQLSRFAGYLARMTARMSAREKEQVQTLLSQAGYGWLSPEQLDRAIRNCRAGLD